MPMNQGPGPFGVPSGQVCVETPDGHVETYGDGGTYANLTNGGFAYGGPDAAAKRSYTGEPGISDFDEIHVSQKPQAPFRPG